MELQEQLELFEHTESDKVLNIIHTEVREQLRKCLDSNVRNGKQDKIWE